MTTVSIGSGGVTPANVLAVARGDARIELAPEAQEAMAASAAIVQQLACSERPVYGVSTGFGSLATTPIPAERREELQQRLVRSHAAGMGEPVEREVVRAMFFLRVRSLAMGRSGTRPAVAETMVGLLNAGITPVVPEHGSLGASGDLVPLAHCALVVRARSSTLADAGAPPARCSLRRGSRRSR